MVTITVMPVNEPPIFTVTNSEDGSGFSNAGKSAAVVSFEEGSNITTVLATFGANDPEDDSADPSTLGIRGADSGKFDIQYSEWRAHLQSCARRRAQL